MVFMVRKKYCYSFLITLFLTTLSENSFACKAIERSYAERFLMKELHSALSKCAIGSLINFNTLKLFDPFGMLFDAAGKKLCGRIRDITNPYIDRLNDGISDYNDALGRVQYGEDLYDDWIQETLNGPHGAQRYPLSETIEWRESPGWPGSSSEFEDMQDYQENNYQFPPDPKDNVIVIPETGSDNEITTPPTTNGRLIKRGGIIGNDISPVKDWDEIYKGITQ